MSTPIEGISAAGVSPLSTLSFEGDVEAPGATGGGAFANSLTGAMENLQQLQASSNELTVQAVTGDLQDIHQAMIASSRASVTLDLVVAVRDRSVSAFNEIMRMQA